MTFVLEASSAGTDLVLTGPWTADARRQITVGAADGVVLNYARGYRGEGLEILRGLPVRRLEILARTIRDLDPIYELASTLEELHVETHPAGSIDLSRLPMLRRLSAFWEQVRGSVEQATQLTDLFILGYNDVDLVSLSALKSLSKLTLKEYPQIRTLDGVQCFSALSELGVHLAPELSDISALSDGRGQIEHLLLTHCQSLSDISALQSCTDLRYLNLSEGGALSSLASLSNLGELERLYLYGSTFVADFDLAPLMRLNKLRELRMKSRREYRPAVSQVKDLIAQRALGAA